MTNNEVVINGRYIAKVSGKQTIVQIKCARSIGRGWSAINCYTGRAVSIRSAQRLRQAVSEVEFQKALATVAKSTNPLEQLPG